LELSLKFGKTSPFFLSRPGIKASALARNTKCGPATSGPQNENGFSPQLKIKKLLCLKREAIEVGNDSFNLLPSAADEPSSLRLSSGPLDLCTVGRVFVNGAAPHPARDRIKDRAIIVAKCDPKSRLPTLTVAACPSREVEAPFTVGEASQIPAKSVRRQRVDRMARSHDVRPLIQGVCRGQGRHGGGTPCSARSILRVAGALRYVGCLLLGLAVFVAWPAVAVVR
jgi:hypothetical protein